ncbi:MAG: HAD family hydrolase [Firmicutes bacterium]|nr:HAD family hydrolase [Bacillota bacterium]
MIKAVVFDLDDTLYDFLSTFYAGMMETLRLHALTRAWEPESVYEVFDRHSTALWPLIEDNVLSFAAFRRLRLTRTLDEMGGANGAADLAMKKVQHLGLSSYFSERRVVVSEVFGSAKPDLGIFVHALNELGVEASEAVFVGDSWEADVVGSVNAGMAAVWLRREAKAALTSDHPVAVIDSLPQVLAFLEILDADHGIHVAQ